METDNNIDSNRMDENYLKEIDSEIQVLKSKKEFEKCIKLIEKSLTLKTNLYGQMSNEVINTARDLCEVCNLIALALYDQNRKEEGLDYLHKCEKLFMNYHEILLLAYNNLGNYYNLLSNYPYSLQYLEKSLNTAHRLKNKLKCAESHFNLTLVLMSLKKTKLAAEQCLACIILIQEELNNIKYKENEQLAIDPTYSMLIKSYYYLAIIQENLNNYPHALLYYEMFESLTQHFEIQELNDFSIKNKIDPKYKIKLINKISKNKTETNDKTGNYFIGKYSESLKQGYSTQKNV